MSKSKKNVNRRRKMFRKRKMHNEEVYIYDVRPSNLPEDKIEREKYADEYLKLVARRPEIPKNFKNFIVPEIQNLSDGMSRPATYNDMTEDDLVFDEHLRKFALSRSKADSEKILTLINKEIDLAVKSNSFNSLDLMMTLKYTIESAKKVG